MSGTKILTCTCEHKFQDGKYGKYRRVHNRVNPSSNVEEYRCTVCGKERKTS